VPENQSLKLVLKRKTLGMAIMLPKLERQMDE